MRFYLTDAAVLGNHPMVAAISKMLGFSAMRREGSFAEEIVSTQFDQGK